MLSSSQTSAPVRDGKSFLGMPHLQKQLQTNTLSTLDARRSTLDAVARLNAAASYDKLNDMMHSDKRQAELHHTRCGRKIDDGDSATLKGSGWSP